MCWQPADPAVSLEVLRHSRVLGIGLQSLVAEIQQANRQPLHVTGLHVEDVAPEDAVEQASEPDKRVAREPGSGGLLILPCLLMAGRDFSEASVRCLSSSRASFSSSLQ